MSEAAIASCSENRPNHATVSPVESNDLEVVDDGGTGSCRSRDRRQGQAAIVRLRLGKLRETSEAREVDVRYKRARSSGGDEPRTLDSSAGNGSVGEEAGREDRRRIAARLYEDHGKRAHEVRREALHQHWRSCWAARTSPI